MWIADYPSFCPLSFARPQLLIHEIAGEVIGFVPSFDRSRVAPPSVDPAVRHGTTLDIGVAHITYLILAAPAWLKLVDDIVNARIVEVHAHHGILALRNRGLLDDLHIAIADKSIHTVARGVRHLHHQYARPHR